MNSKATRMALLLVGLSTAACAPTIGLRKPTRFTASGVRDVSWNDRCHLQAFFDKSPPNNELVLERGYMVPGRRSTQERGTVSYRVSHPVQQAMWQKMMRRYYKNIPAGTFAPGFLIEVRYYRYCGRLRMLVRSPIIIRTATSEHHLAYHPCVGELLLNGDLYAFRARHLMQELASKPKLP